MVFGSVTEILKLNHPLVCCLSVVTSKHGSVESSKSCDNCKFLLNWLLVSRLSFSECSRITVSISYNLWALSFLLFIFNVYIVKHVLELSIMKTFPEVTLLGIYLADVHWNGEGCIAYPTCMILLVFATKYFNVKQLIVIMSKHCNYHYVIEVRPLACLQRKMFLSWDHARVTKACCIAVLPVQEAHRRLTSARGALCACVC